MENFAAADNKPTSNIEIYNNKAEVNLSACLPPRHAGVRNNHRSVAPKPHDRPYYGKNNRVFDRSKSNRRRFYSNDGSQRRRGSHQRIIQQPYGWYQVDQIGRNQSLEPRLPVCEPNIISNTSKRNKRRRNRRHSRKPNDSQSTYVPSNFKSTASLMRELPFARLHYNSFRRLFPNLPTRTMKDKKFRTEVIKEMPFFKCTNSQLLYVWKDPSPLDLLMVTNDPSVCSVQMSGGTDKESIAWLPEPSTKMLGGTECDSETDFGEEDTNAATTLCDLTEACLHRRGDGTASPKTSTQLDHDISESISGDAVSTSSECATSRMSQLPIKDKVCAEESKIDSLPYIDVDGDVSAILDSQASTNTDSEKFINQLSLQNISIPKGSMKSVQSSEIGVCPQLTHRTYASTSASVKKQFPRSSVCYTCAEIAYPAERVETDDKVFHTGCFRCHHCCCMLQRGGWNQRGLNYYCNPCHRRLALQTLRH